MVTNTFTSESVTVGHPDKLADQISDAVLDALLARDSLARVACETYITAGLVVVGGEVASTSRVDVGQIVRDTIEAAGYTRPEFGFDVESATIITALHHQSPDIAQGVMHALEERTGRQCNGFDETGAGDMGSMYGFACDETPELMPLPITLAHRLAYRLTEVRRIGLIPYLRPDGKVQVTVAYAGGRPVAVTSVVVSAQHEPDVDIEGMLRPALLNEVLKPAIPPELVDYRQLELLLNTTGKFVIGGPAADTGLSGRKQAVDSYGGMGRHGGSSFSGKDPTKVDRSAAYGARYVAKNVVAAGLARRCEVQVSYAIGMAHPVSVAIDTFGTEQISLSAIDELVASHFDLRPAALISQLDLQRPIYKKTAVFGHFGRADAVFSWEKTDKADILRRAAGL